MDRWRTFTFQASGQAFRPSATGLELFAFFERGAKATFGGRRGEVVEFGSALYRVPGDLPQSSRQSQYEVAFAHLLQLLPAFRSAGATDFILHMHRKLHGECNEEFTSAELRMLASLDCRLVYVARTESGDGA